MLRAGIVAVGMLAAVPAFAKDFSAANPAPTGVSAYVDLGGGYTWFNPSGGQANHWDVQGRINFWLGPRASVQIDGWDEELHYIGNGDNRFYGGAAHFSLRDPSSHLVGGMVSVGNSFGANYAAAAFEAQRYIGNWTLYGQAGYSWSFGEIDHETAPYAQLVARYFFNPDLMVEAQGGYAWYAQDPAFGPDYGVARFQARIEKKFPRLPLAGFIAYQVNVFGSSGTPTQQSVLAGFKLLTAGSLKAVDRNGPTLIDLNPLFGYPIWR
jgi:hypothetical protein